MDLFSADNLWKVALAGTFLLGLIFAILRNPKAALIAIGGMIFLASLGLAKEAGKSTDFRTWLLPLQERRNILCAGCALLAALAVFAHSYRVNLRQTPFLGWVYLLQGITMGTINILHGEISGGGLVGGMMAIAFAITISGSLILYYSVILKDWDDYLSVVRTIAFGGLLWTLGCTVQFFINHKILTTGAAGRFTGLSANPQHAAGLSAVISMVAIWLTMNDPKKRLKPLWLFVVGTHILFIMWSGSRTGALCALVGYAAILYARLGRTILLMPVAVAVIAGLVMFASDQGVKFGFDRLTSTDDTRSVAWATLIQTGLRNPVIGVGAMEAGASENGFLYGFASYGFLIPILLFAQLCISGYLCLMLIRARVGAGEFQKRLADLCIGFFCTYWLGNMAEGYGIARMSPQVVLFLTFACLSSGALYMMRQEAHAASFDAPEALPDLSDGTDYSWYGRSA